MEISYLGHASFRLKGKSCVVVTDPFDPDQVGIKYLGVSADLVTISHDHSDHNRADLVDSSPYIIKGPGEYEVKGVTVLGYPTFHDDEKGEERGKNTVYVYEMDELRLVHLGDLGHKLDDKLVEEIGDIDILFIPVGGFYTIDPRVAVEVVQSVEPHVVIPMHYNTPVLNQEVFGKLSGVDEFVKLLAVPAERLQKYSVKKPEIAEEQKAVILEVR